MPSHASSLSTPIARSTSTTARLPLVALILLLAMVPGRALAIVADSASDVCAADADPCVVTEVVQMTDDAVLDFGARMVSVIGAGSFDFSDGGASILCGGFTASTTGPAIVATVSDQDDPYVNIVARRACSGNGADVPCLEDDDCDRGLCTVRRCQDRGSLQCHADIDCQESCLPWGECGNASSVSCETDADCYFGPCLGQLTCSWNPPGHAPLACASNADCENGSCTVGDGSIELDAAVKTESGVYPKDSTVYLTAADSVRLSNTVDISGIDRASDGGYLSILTYNGDIVTTGKVRAVGRAEGVGGIFELTSGRDVEVLGDVNVTGGFYDGGVFDVVADRDVHIGASVNASARIQDGYGGDVYADADGDLTIDGGPLARRVRWKANGHAFEGSGGDGGQFEFQAKGNLIVDENVRFVANGAMPGGGGGLLVASSAAGLQFDADVVARRRQNQGYEGLVIFITDGSATVGASSFIDADLVEMRSDMDLHSSADINVNTKYGGPAGEVIFRSGATATLAGTISGKGNGGGAFEVDACRVILDSGNSIRNLADGGLTTITAHERMDIRAGSEMLTPKGSNVLVYRAPAKPPIVSGMISPSPQLQLDELLSGCPVCGNSEIDAGETCDDGNTNAGDGCDSGCLTE